MLWKLNKESAEPIPVKTIQFSGIGPIAVYQVGSDYYMEASDMTSMGLWRDKLLKEELPKIRKSLGVSTIQDKLRDVRIRKISSKEEEDEPIRKSIENSKSQDKLKNVKVKISPEETDELPKTRKLPKNSPLPDKIKGS